MLSPRAKIFWPLRATDWNGPKSERNFLGVNELFVNIVCNPELTPWTEAADHPLLGQTAISCSVKAQ
jgi:hypothetical protein